MSLNLQKKPKKKPIMIRNGVLFSFSGVYIGLEKFSYCSSFYETVDQLWSPQAHQTNIFIHLKYA